MEHAELSWLLSSVTPLGELNRMHQFRDKSAAQRELVVRRAALLPGAPCPPTCSPTAPTRCRWGRTSASTWS